MGNECRCDFIASLLNAVLDVCSTAGSNYFSVREKGLGVSYPLQSRDKSTDAMLVDITCYTTELGF